MNAPAVTQVGIADRLRGAGKGVFALALLVGWLVLMRRQDWIAETGGGVFALGFLLVAGTVGGHVAAIFKLPRLTGYLAVGVLSGPYVLELFSVEDVRSLTLINGLALALIALQAGAELTISMLKRSLRSLSWAMVTHTVIIGVGMTALFTLVAPSLDFMAGLELPAIIAVGGVWAAMAISKAATDTLAILGETRAKGPLPEHALGVVVAIDVVVLVLFAVTLMLANAALNPSAELSWAVLEHLGMELVASVAAGTTFGLLIAFYFWAIGRERLLFTVAAAYGITAFCAYFQYDTLLVFVVAGFVVMNLTKEGPHLVETTESAAAAVMVVFFATAGAQLDIGTLAVFGPIAVALAGGRIALTVTAAKIGHKLADDPPAVRRYGWTAFISQAGVTIGLATIAADRLGEVGEGLAMLLIAVIGINELIGPVAFKIGLGKAAKLPSPEEEAAPVVEDAPSGAAKAEAFPHEVLDQIEAAIDKAAAGLEHEVEAEPERVSVFLLLDTDQSTVEGTITLTPAGGRVRLALVAKLAGVSPHAFRLKPKKGVLSLVERIGDLKTGDASLDDGFIVEAPDAARPFLRRLAPAILAAGVPMMLEAEHTNLKAEVRSLPPEQTPLATVVTALIETWRAVSVEARERRSRRRP